MLLSCFTASGNKRARISVIRFCIFISILIFAFQATGYLAVAYASTFSGSYLAAQHAASTKSFESAARYYNEVVEKITSSNPSYAKLLEQAMVYNTTAGNFEQASDIAQKLKSVGKDGELINITLALGYIVNEDYPQALRNLYGNTTLAERNFLTNLIAAWIYYEMKHFTKAQNVLSLIEPNPAFGALVQYHKALILSLVGETDQAEKIFQQAIETQENSQQLIRAYGQFLEKKGDIESAKRLYLEYMQKNPGNLLVSIKSNTLKNRVENEFFIQNGKRGIQEVFYNIAGILSNDRNTDYALVYTQLASYLQPFSPEILILLGDIFDKYGRYHLAISAYEKVPQDSSLHEIAQFGKAIVLNKKNKTQKALTILNAIIAQNKDSIHSWALKGEILRYESRFYEAIASYNNAIDLISDYRVSHWSLYYARGISYERVNRWKYAQRDLEQALKLEPNGALILNYFGYSLLEKGLHMQRAYNMLKRAASLRPNDGFIIDSLGWAFYKLEDYKNAVKYLEKAIELSPEESVINEHLGDALWQTDRHREAEFQWGKALSLTTGKQNKKLLIHKIRQGLDGDILAVKEISAKP
jgi:tetratricopeptide (TPR) repeat protein